MMDQTLKYDTFAYLTKPVTRDVVCKTVTEAAQKASEKLHNENLAGLFHCIFDSSPNPILVCDLSLDVQFVNPAFSAVFGYTREEALGRPIQIVPQADMSTVRSEISDLINGKPLAERETLRVTKDGTSRDVTRLMFLYRNSLGEPQKIVVIYRDITETKAMERQLVQAEKMSVLGQVSARIAHEINNPLQVIRGYTEMLQANSTLDEEVKSGLSAIQDASAIISRLSQDLREVARPREINFSQIKAESPLKLALAFLKRSGVLKQCTITKHYQDSIPFIYGDAFQLHQVFMNILLNACHAMEKSSTRNISIKTAYDQEQRSVLISVGDTGYGITPEDLGKIFDPFFSTRFDVGGTGLGLPVAKSIVEKHGGTIDFESKINEGTTFHIRIPVDGRNGNQG